MRYVLKRGEMAATVPHAPFVLYDRDQRGHGDSQARRPQRGRIDGPRRIMPRLYEAFGGHASIGLYINVVTS